MIDLVRVIHQTTYLVPRQFNRQSVSPDVIKKVTGVAPYLKFDGRQMASTFP